MILQDWLDDLKRRVDLVALGSACSVDWGNTKGSDMPKARCPFHNEKTSSFVAHQEKTKTGFPLFHCYGACSRSWDAIEFYRQATGEDFLPTVEYLAGMVGMSVPRGGETPAQAAARKTASELREQGRAALAAAQDWFAASLFAKTAPEAAEARAYLQRRGFPFGSNDPFGFGYAPRDGWLLVRHLERAGFGLSTLEHCGLVKPGEDGALRKPRFWGRVTVPIRDRMGRVLSFAGRVLDNSEPKYLNGPDTEFFHKGEVLYGLDLAAAEIRERGRALVVEGHFDVVACHLADLRHCVATQGTAFTEAHAALLRRHTSVVVFAYDNDDAGRRGLERALPLCLAAGLTPRVVVIEGVKDADDALRIPSAEQVPGLLAA